MTPIEITRTTRETRIRICILPDPGATRAATTLPFLDHMLGTLARYANVGLVVEATGDLPHHIAEDVAISLGKAIARLTPAACARYGDRTVPMDDALVHCALDLGGRAYYRGGLPSTRYEHFMRSLSDNAAMTLHLRVLRGRDRHHVIEAAFKALGLALRQALAAAAEGDAVFSTKGSVVLEER
jgi:imidazoleglycerol-phosphate dehydratase